MHCSVLRGLTCNAADLRETHHDLREAFGLVRVLVFSVVLTHIPVALVQLLKLGGVGQASDICSNTNKKTESCGEYRKSRDHAGLSNNRRGCVVTLVKEVDSFHTGILLVTDLQLVKLAKQIYQPLHHLHAILTEAEESDTDFSNTLEKNSGI